MIIKIATKKQRAFVLLFAVMLSSIILAIALGVSNIAFKEQKFSTSAKDTNEAFFATDVGAECALFNDKSTINKFPIPASATPINNCAGLTPTPTLSNVTATTATYSFPITGLANSLQACAKITVLKDNTFPPIKTTITSEGLNIGDASCNPVNSNSVEREIKVSY